MAKSRLREKELRRRRHRHWKRKKQRLKQAVLEARLRKLERQQQTGEPAAVAEPVPAAMPPAAEVIPEVSTVAAEPTGGEASPQDPHPQTPNF